MRRSRYRAFWYEDLGPRGDVTTRWALPDPRRRVKGRIYARHPVVASGVRHAVTVLRDQRVRVLSAATDGHKTPAGRSLIRFQGPAAGVLAAERLALNLLGRMCGIATLTRRLQDRVARTNPRCRVAGTRKTTPGFRAFEKEAIVHGGGDPHRWGLWDAVLIKDNHLVLLDDLEAAVVRVRRRAKGKLPVEVEVTTVAEAEAAARGGADWILIDNQGPATARRIAAAARRVKRDLRIEVSGGLHDKNLVPYARFADRLSLGALTHSAPAADVTLELAPKA